MFSSAFEVDGNALNIGVLQGASTTSRQHVAADTSNMLLIAAFSSLSLGEKLILLNNGGF